MPIITTEGISFRPGRERKEDRRWARDEQERDREKYKHGEGRHGRHGGDD